jgi:hypothetical protein
MRRQEHRRQDTSHFSPEEAARCFAKAEEKAGRRRERQEGFARWIALKPEQDRTEREKALLWKVQRRLHMQESMMPGESLKEHILRLQQKPQIERNPTEERLVQQWGRRLQRLKRQKQQFREASGSGTEQEIVISWSRVENYRREHNGWQSSSDGAINGARNNNQKTEVLSLNNMDSLMNRMNELGLSSDKLKDV